MEASQGRGGEEGRVVSGVCVGGGGLRYLGRGVGLRGRGCVWWWGPGGRRDPGAGLRSVAGAVEVPVEDTVA